MLWGGVGWDGMSGAQSWGGDSAMLGVKKLKEAGPESKPRSPMPSFGSSHTLVSTGSFGWREQWESKDNALL